MSQEYSAKFKTVRLVYFDEAGSSQDEVQEPIITVASIIVHGDLQTGPIEQDVEEIIDHLVPEHLRRNFEFHAKELFSGSDKFRGWPRSERYAAVTAFLQLIPKHNLPVHCIGIVKAGFWKAIADVKKVRVSDLSRETAPHIMHEAAFMNCAAAVEVWFKHYAPLERGFCIADQTKARDNLKSNFREFQKESFAGFEDTRLDHLIDTIYFGNSNESRFLQLADCCAFFIKRTMMQRRDAEPFYEIIRRRVAPLPLRILFKDRSAQP